MDYQLKPLGKTCAATGKPLMPGTECHSIVIERDGQLVRLDYSHEGWTKPPANVIGYWKQRIPESKHPDSLRIDPDRLLPYFEQLCENSDPGLDRLRYAAALWLLKSKRLKLDDVGPSSLTGDEALHLAGVRGEGVFEVRNLNLSDSDLTAAQHELRVHLSTEWS